MQQKEDIIDLNLNDHRIFKNYFIIMIIKICFSLFRFGKFEYFLYIFILYNVKLYFKEICIFSARIRYSLKENQELTGNQRLALCQIQTRFN